MTNEEVKYFSTEFEKLEIRLNNFAGRYRAQRSGAFKEIKKQITELKESIPPLETKEPDDMQMNPND